MNDQINSLRTRIARYGALLFERRLTDMAGGNISARAGDLICITGRYAGSKHHWQLEPEQVLVVDLEGNQLEGDGVISREAKVHLRLYREFPEAQAVVHAHAQSVMVFCAVRQPIVPVLEANHKFGIIKVVDYASAHSTDLAENIARGLRGQEDHLRKQAAAVIAPWHGLFVMGRDLEAAVDAVERIDTNARCLLQARLLPGVDFLTECTALDSALRLNE